MMIAGLELSPELVADLATCLLDDGLFKMAERLLEAEDNGDTDIELSLQEREAILWALAACPDELLQLRAVLMNDLQWRRRELF